MKHSFFTALWAFSLPAAAQDYSMAWSTTDAGGGTASGGSFSLEGTIGQTDAGAAAGDAFALNSGYWGIGTTAVPGPLFAGIEPPHEGHGDALLRLYWFLPQPAGTVLEFSTDMETWSAVQVADVESEYYAALWPPRGFYRLTTPE